MRTAIFIFDVLRFIIFWGPHAYCADSLVDIELDSVSFAGDIEVGDIASIGGGAVTTRCTTTVTNGHFDDWTGDDPDDWTFGPAEDADDYITESSGKARMVGDGGESIRLYTDANVFSNGVTYNWSINITTLTAGRLRLYQNNNVAMTDGTLTTQGVHTGSWTATADGYLAIYGHLLTNVTDVTFDEVCITVAP